MGAREALMIMLLICFLKVIGHCGGARRGNSVSIFLDDTSVARRRTPLIAMATRLDFVFSRVIGSIGLVVEPTCTIFPSYAEEDIDKCYGTHQHCLRKQKTIA